MLNRQNIDEWYYTEDMSGEDRGILRVMEDKYSEAVTLNQSFWSEADIDTRFKAGDQTLWNDIYGNLPAYRRKQFYFNRIRRIVNMITGYQRKHRKSIIAIPVENNDQETSDQYSKLLLWTFNKSNAQECISRAFDAGTVTTGMGLINIYMDYSADPVSGDIKCDFCPYSSFLIDPYFKKQDLSDCNFIWRRQWMSKKQLEILLPGREEDIQKLTARGNRDGKFQFQAEAYNYGMYELHSYDEYWYRDTREQTILHDSESGEVVEWKGEDEELEEFLAMYPQIIMKKTIVPTVKLAIVVEGEVFYNGKNPMGIDKYPFVPFLGYYEPEIPYFPWRVQGVVRGLRDAQFLYNRRKVIELDILESQVNSGFKYKVDSLVNPKDIYLEGQGKGIALKKGADMSDVEKIQPAQIPPSMMQLSELLGKEIQEISGVNEELLGMATDDKPGILSMLRQGAGLTTLQVLFDQLDNSVKLMGRVYMDLIQENFSPGKVKRVIGQQPTQQFFQRSFAKFDVEIEEGLNTTTQRQLQFAQLLQLREIGVPIPAGLLLESSTLQNKNMLVEAVQRQEDQQNQQMQQQAQTQNALLQAQIESYGSKSLADKGLGVERLSRVQENRALAVERLAEADKDRELANLNMAKTMKEIEDLDLTQIERLFALVQQLKMMNSQSEDESVNIKEREIRKDFSPSPLLGEQTQPAAGLGALSF